MKVLITHRPSKMMHPRMTEANISMILAMAMMSRWKLLRKRFKSRYMKFMKKMAIAFQTFKKNLNKDYVKKGLTPDFENNYKKQRPFWDEFI
jgi:hypothetical protein